MIPKLWRLVYGASEGRTVRILVVCLVGLSIGIFQNSAVFAGERWAVAVPVANVRSGPATSQDILWKVEKHHPLNILEKSGEWYYFSDFENDKGWIHKSLLDQTATIITRKENCNVRSGPGTNYAIVFVVESGIPFKVLGRKKNWVHIQHADGDQGWIYRPLVW